jgi:membrane protein DedA with SNARE-associated domain
MLEFVNQLIEFLISSIGSLGYLGIFILMAIESSIIPLPSELVLIPAGVLVLRGEMSLYLLMAAAVLGSLTGALLSYYFAFYFGRRAVDKLIQKYGKFFFINEERMNRTERFFENYGSITVFTGRLIFGVRHLISLPAGLAKMNIPKFILYTSLGAGFWSLILIFSGYYFGENQATILTNLDKIGWAAIGIIIILGVFYWLFRKKKI